VSIRIIGRLLLGNDAGACRRVVPGRKNPGACRDRLQKNACKSYDATSVPLFASSPPANVASCDNEGPRIPGLLAQPPCGTTPVAAPEARMLPASVTARSAAGQGTFGACNSAGRAKCLQSLPRSAVDPGGAAFLAESLEEPDRLFRLASPREGPEPR